MGGKIEDNSIQREHTRERRGIERGPYCTKRRLINQPVRCKASELDRIVESKEFRRERRGDMGERCTGMLKRRRGKQVSLIRVFWQMCVNTI